MLVARTFSTLAFRFYSKSYSFNSISKTDSILQFSCKLYICTDYYRDQNCFLLRSVETTVFEIITINNCLNIFRKIKIPLVYILAVGYIFKNKGRLTQVIFYFHCRTYILCKCNKFDPSAKHNSVMARTTLPRIENTKVLYATYKTEIKHLLFIKIKK